MQFASVASENETVIERLIIIDGIHADDYFDPYVVNDVAGKPTIRDRSK